MVEYVNIKFFLNNNIYNDDDDITLAYTTFLMRKNQFGEFVFFGGSNKNISTTKNLHRNKKIFLLKTILKLKLYFKPNYKDYIFFMVFYRGTNKIVTVK